MQITKVVLNLKLPGLNSSSNLLSLLLEYNTARAIAELHIHAQRPTIFIELYFEKKKEQTARC